MTGCHLVLGRLVLAEEGCGHVGQLSLHVCYELVPHVCPKLILF